MAHMVYRICLVSSSQLMSFHFVVKTTKDNRFRLDRSFNQNLDRQSINIAGHFGSQSTIGEMECMCCLNGTEGKNISTQLQIDVRLKPLLCR